MNLNEIKTQVRFFFPGKAQAWINGKVKEITNGGDLRCKSTWEDALTILVGTEIPSPISQQQIDAAIAVLDALPSKTTQPVKIAPKTVKKAIAVLDALPMREIAPSVFLVGRVEPALPLVA